MERLRSSGQVYPKLLSYKYMIAMNKMVQIAIACGALTSATAFAETKPSTIWSPAASDNYTVSSLSRGINYVVIHVTEGSATGAVSWFKNSSSNVSAHYVVAHSGTIYQCVADSNIAWHAGNWTYNVHSIGIEHEGFTAQNTWTDAQYRASAALTRWICLTYGVPMDRSHIIGHIEVPGATHTDPGPSFNWTFYMSLVRGSSAPPPTSILAAKETTATSLNVRSGPSTDNPIIGTIPEGQRYVAIAQDSGWYKIYYADNTGWCSGAFLNTVTGVTGSLVTADSLNVRTGPGTSNASVGFVSSGQRYIRTAVSADWEKIYWNGNAYWISGSFTTNFDL